MGNIKKKLLSEADVDNKAFNLNPEKLSDLDYEKFNNNKDALDDKALTSQFHIIHPQVVK